MNENGWLMLCFSVVGSMVLFLTDWVKGWGDFCCNEEGKIIKSKFMATFALFIGAGVATFIFTQLFFNTPIMSELQGYRDVSCVVGGTFGTMLIPALRVFIEAVVDNRMAWAKRKLEIENEKEKNA